MTDPIHLINQCLQSWFDFPKNKIYCQVATIGNNTPHIRTMELYDVTVEGNVILMTDTITRKWSDLKIDPQTAVCAVQVNRGQIIMEGAAVLITANSDERTAQFYWQHYLDQYWRDFYLSHATLTQTIPDSFGIISVTPRRLEITEINNNDFLKSSRQQFIRQGNSWVIENLRPV